MKFILPLAGRRRPTDDKVFDVVEDTAKHIKELAMLSTTLGHAERRAMHRSAEISGLVQSAAIKCKVMQGSSGPMIRRASMDGTTVKCRRVLDIKLPSGATERHLSTESHEFLLAHEIVAYEDLLGNRQMAAKFITPRVMVHGKTAPIQWETLRHQFQTLRANGAKGPASEFYCIDRGGGFELLERLFKAWHNLYAPTYGEEDSMFTPEDSELTEFVFFIGCVLHDCQKAIEWSWKDLFEDETFVTDVWVGLESIISSRDLITRHIGRWAAQNISYHQPWSLSIQDHWKMVWDCLGVPPETAELLAEVLQFSLQDNKLEVTTDMGHDDVVAKLVPVLQSAYTGSKNFTKSRWLSFGSAARLHTVCMMTGLPKLIANIRKVSHTLYYLNGYAKITECHEKFLAQVALACRPVESVMAEMMEDSRVMRRLQEIKDIMIDELDYLANLPKFVWARIAEACGCNIDDFIDDTMTGAHLSCGFLIFRIVKTAERRPWRLCLGNVAKNLDELQQEPEPAHDQVTWKLWMCLQRGHPRKAKLVNTVEGWTHVPWDAALTESQHANIASLMRHHPDYLLETLMSRSEMMMTNKVMPKIPKRQQNMAKLQAKVKKVLKTARKSWRKARLHQPSVRQNSIANERIGDKEASQGPEEDLP